MCRLRCFVKNNGSGNIIELVRYRREKVFQAQRRKATGTDGIELDVREVRPRRRHINHDLSKYYDTLQVTLGSPVGTVRKTFAIRNRLDEI